MLMTVVDSSLFGPAQERSAQWIGGKIQIYWLSIIPTTLSTDIRLNHTCDMIYAKNFNTRTNESTQVCAVGSRSIGAH